MTDEVRRAAAKNTPKELEIDEGDHYSTGEMPEVGDMIECLPDEGSFPHLREGEQYTVLEIDCGYLFTEDNQGWWPCRFALVQRKPERNDDGGNSEV